MTSKCPHATVVIVVYRVKYSHAIVVIVVYRVKLHMLQ